MPVEPGMRSMTVIVLLEIEELHLQLRLPILEERVHQFRTKTSIRLSGLLAFHHLARIEFYKRPMSTETVEEGAHVRRRATLQSCQFGRICS